MGYFCHYGLLDTLYYCSLRRPLRHKRNERHVPVRHSYKISYYYFEQFYFVCTRDSSLQTLKPLHREIGKVLQAHIKSWHDPCIENSENCTLKYLHTRSLILKMLFICIFFLFLLFVVLQTYLVLCAFYLVYRHVNNLQHSYL